VIIRESSSEAGSSVELRVQLWSVNQQATEAEESPLLRFVTRKRLMQTSQRNYQVKASENRLRRLSVK
jgi:hypothetical protein